MRTEYILILPTGEKVGSVGVMPLTGRSLVHRLWVHPDYRGLGLARRLLGNATEDADREGVVLESHPWGLQDVDDEKTDRALYSGLGVVPTAPRSAIEALHESFGFAPVESGEGFHRWVRQPKRGDSIPVELSKDDAKLATVNPIKAHLPWADLMGLSPQEASFQRTHPVVRQYILDGMRGNDGVSFDQWNRLNQIHQIQTRVDRVRARMGRPSPYIHPSKQQPWGNPAPSPTTPTVMMPRVSGDRSENSEWWRFSASIEDHPQPKSSYGEFKHHWWKFSASPEADLSIEDYDGREGNNSHITRNERGMIPLDWIRDMPGGRGELPGQHRNAQGDEWEQFKQHVAAGTPGYSSPIFIVVEHGKPAKIYEGNHRRDAYAELGATHVPVEIRYFGHAEREGTVGDRALRRMANAMWKEANSPLATPHSEVLKKVALRPKTADDRDARGDRWHEYRNRYQPDTLHRGVYAQLDDDIHDYVHDETVPIADRARVLLDNVHRFGYGLGMHWTPHLDIAERSILNAADEAAGPWDEDDWEDHSESAPSTDVIFHIRRPAQRYVVRDPNLLKQHGVGYEFSKDEDETPIKPGAPVHVTGISWRPHNSEYPREAFEHHDFERPVRHEAASPRSKPIFDAEMGGPSGKLQKLVDNMSDIDPDPHLSDLYGDAKWHKDYERLVAGRHGFQGGYEAELDEGGGVAYHKGGSWVNAMGKRIPVAHVIKPVLAANPDKMVGSDPAQEVQYFAVSSIPGDEGELYRTLHEAAMRPNSLANRWNHPGRGYEPRPIPQGARKTAATSEPFPNPYHGNPEFGGNPDFSHTWFHGTKGDPSFGETRGQRGSDDAARIALPPSERVKGTAWHQPNQMMGVHLSPLHEVAHKFAWGSKPSAIVHAKLNFDNPAHFLTEKHLNYAVADWASKHFPEWHDEKLNRDRAWNYSDQEGTHADFSQVPEGYGDKAQDVLQWHPYLPEIIKGFHQHLADQGHHGITYGNMVEGPYISDIITGGNHRAKGRPDPTQDWPSGVPRSISAIAQPKDINVTHVERIAPWNKEPEEGQITWEQAGALDESDDMRHRILAHHREHGGEYPSAEMRRTAASLRIEYESRGSYQPRWMPGSGDPEPRQDYHTYRAWTADGQPAGKLDFSTVGDEAHVEWVESQHPGAGSALMDKLYEDHPEHQVHMGMQTEEGAPFIDRYLAKRPELRGRTAAVDESGLKAAGIAVIAMDTGRVLMQQRALNPLMCPCGQGVTWDEQNGYQHDDGSVSHDGEFYGSTVSDLLDQGHPQEDDGEDDEDDEDGLDKTAALEYDPNEGTWEFPGGKLDEGESARAAAIREFREEVGQDLPPGVFVGAWVSPGGIVVTAAGHGHVPRGETPQELMPVKGESPVDAMNRLGLVDTSGWSHGYRKALYKLYQSHSLSLPADDPRYGEEHPQLVANRARIAPAPPRPKYQDHPSVLDRVRGGEDITKRWMTANAADPVLDGADPRALQGDMQYGIDGVCPVPGRGGEQMADQTAAILPRVASDLPRRGEFEPPQDHSLALIASGWKPRPEGKSAIYPHFTKLSPTTGILHQLYWDQDGSGKWLYDATVPDEGETMGRRTVNPRYPGRAQGGVGSVPLYLSEVDKAAKKFERDYLVGSEHGEPGIAHMFSDRSKSPYDEEYPDLSAVTQRSEPAFERRREGNPVTGEHPEPDVSYDDFRIPAPGEPWVEGYHNMGMLDEPAHMNPFWGNKLSAARKGPIYKGFIYLIQRERDIDLTQREHVNPDDPDGDMTEQSAWWDIKHAKKNPALRKEVKQGTPWAELELWADKSVRSNREVTAMVEKLAMSRDENVAARAKGKTSVHEEGMSREAAADIDAQRVMDVFDKAKAGDESGLPNPERDLPNKEDRVRRGDPSDGEPWWVYDHKTAMSVRVNDLESERRQVTRGKKTDGDKMNSRNSPSIWDIGGDKYLEKNLSRQSGGNEFLTSLVGRALGADVSKVMLTPRGDIGEWGRGTILTKVEPGYRDRFQMDEDEIPEYEENVIRSPRGVRLGLLDTLVNAGDHGRINHGYKTDPETGEKVPHGIDYEDSMENLHYDSWRMNSPYTQHFIDRNAHDPSLLSANPLTKRDVERGRDALIKLAPIFKSMGRENDHAALLERWEQLGHRARGPEGSDVLPEQLPDISLLARESLPTSMMKSFPDGSTLHAYDSGRGRWVHRMFSSGSGPHSMALAKSHETALNDGADWKELGYQAGYPRNLMGRLPINQETAQASGISWAKFSSDMAREAMPTTQEEPAVHGLEGSGEGALNRKVTLTSGEWLAKSPHYKYLNDPEHQDPEDVDYFHHRAAEDADMEEFASRFGRAISDPDDQAIVPEAIRGNKASDTSPTVYVRRYPEYRDMDNGWLDYEDLEYHANSPRGKVMGYFHSVLSDGDHVDHHNMLLLGDPMEEESEKIHRMPTVSIDHTHSSIPAFAEAMSGDDRNYQRDMTWAHRGELSPYARHFLEYRGERPVRKTINPLGPEDTQRALDASETMRPWARERGREDWLDAAQHRMRLLGQRAGGTESIFPYQMAHERVAQQRVAATQPPSRATWGKLHSLISSGRPEFTIRTVEEVPVDHHDMIVGNGRPEYHEERDHRPETPKIYALKSGLRHTFLAPVRHQETGEVGWLRGGDYSGPEQWTFYTDDQLRNAIRGVRPNAPTSGPIPASQRYKRQHATGKPVPQEGDVELDAAGHQVIPYPREDPFAEVARQRGGWSTTGSTERPWWVYA